MLKLISYKLILLKFLTVDKINNLAVLNRKIETVEDKINK